jgi:4-amino-4-deoxy-L-arabinose transferase-like glycosyltransferase
MREGRLKTLILGVVPLVLYALMLTVSPLMEPDEGRYSAIPSAMNETGDYVTPRLLGAVYFEKPPLSYWATALAFKVFGENEFSSRIFSGLCAWGLILLVYRMGVYFHDRRSGLYGAAVLSTFLYHAAIGRINILDMPLAFFVCLAIWAGFRYLDGTQRPRNRLYQLYLFSALAFLAKGLIGIVFPFGVLVVWLLVSRRWRELFSLASPVGMLVFGAVALPWLILVQKANPDFFRFFFIQEHFLRYATRMHSRYQPVYFYLPIILAGTLPWSAFLPEAMRGFWKGRERVFGTVEKRLFSAWVGVILVFFSISSSKLIPYIAPIFPPLALGMGHIFRRCEEDLRQTSGSATRRPLERLPVILQTLIFMAVLLGPPFLKDSQISLTAWWPWIVIPFILQGLIIWLPQAVRNRTGKGWFLTIYLLFALFLAAVIFPVSRYIAPYKSAQALSQAVKEHLPEGETLYQYGMRLYGIEFYTGLRTPIVDDIGEVGYGSEQLPPEERERYFLSSATFFPLVRQRGHLYCASQGGERLAMLKKEIPALKVLWHNHEYYLLRLEHSEKGTGQQ